MSKSLQQQLLVWVLGSLLSIGLVIQVGVFIYTYRQFNASQEANLSYLAELVSSRATVRMPRSEKRPSNRPLIPPPTTTTNTPTPDTQTTDSPTSHRPNTTPNTTGSPTLNDDDNVLQYQSVKDGIQVDIIPTRLHPPANPLDRRFDTPSNNAQPSDMPFSPTATHIALLNAPVGFSQITLEDKVWKVFRKNTPRRIVFVRQPIEWQKKLALASAWQAIVPILLTTLLLLMVLPLVLRRVLRPIQLLAKQMAQRHGQDLSPIIIPTDSHHQANLPDELLPLVNETNGLLVRVAHYIDSQQRFIADAAHELRSPLTAISLQVQQLQKYSQDPTLYTDPSRQQKLKQSIEKLAIRVEHNQHLVEQLLTLARMEAQQANASADSQRQTDLISVLTQVVTLLLPIADSKRQHLVVDNRLAHLTPNPLMVHLEETALFILLKNLLQNALLYTPNAGHITITVDQFDALSESYHKPAQLSASFAPTAVLKHPNKPNTEPHSIVVQIADTGIGIDPAHYQSVFTPFVRLEQHATQIQSSDTIKKTNAPLAANSGTGLGLSIVYQICQQAHIDLYLSATPTLPVNDNSQLAAQGLTVTLVF